MGCTWLASRAGVRLCTGPPVDRDPREGTPALRHGTPGTRTGRSHPRLRREGGTGESRSLGTVRAFGVAAVDRYHLARPSAGLGSPAPGYPPAWLCAAR